MVDWLPNRGTSTDASRHLWCFSFWCTCVWSRAREHVRWCHWWSRGSETRPVATRLTLITPWKSKAWAWCVWRYHQTPRTIRKTFHLDRCCRARRARRARRRRDWLRMRHLCLEAGWLVASLLLVAMPGAPSGFLLLVASLFLVVRPGATSSVLAPSSDALCS